MTTPREIIASAANRYMPSARIVKRWRRIAHHTPQSWVIGLLDQIARDRLLIAVGESQPSQSRGWLLRFRPQFRRVEESQPAAAIRHYLLDCPEGMAPMAMWLLGRCASRTQQYDLFQFAVNAPVAVQRHAARALRRVEAWSKLRVLAAAAPRDLKIAWYAQSPVTKRVFRERLQNFAVHVDHSHAAEAAGASRMALWFADIDWIRCPPKSVAYIREILRRIHRWVHGAD